MITLYTWLPTPVTVVLEAHIPPDIGHSALDITHEDGSSTYVSFWPEVDGLIGRLTYPVKPRTIRNPVSYEIESDRTQPYMQRKADFEDTVVGLDKLRIAAGWQSVQDLPYDLKRWNCSNVVRLLILTSMDPGQLGLVLKASDFKLEDMEGGRSIDLLRATLLEVAASNLFDCKPNDVRRLAKALAAVN
ncbi:hypothetical protein CCAX7_15100 [Capsulimonas corticalis]|uniref:Uncharacterized protein n=1 Tax=Capsulimonas corticalis TaxID=2219043 RepID=A0A402CZC9_9BACT|nr:hypothetical protein [Capsulimonas corticalis]BDI29459.1 hypothetical protein CCAX7_15100 [Capsulimonas corticalis]